MAQHLVRGFDEVQDRDEIYILPLSMEIAKSTVDQLINPSKFAYEGKPTLSD